MRRAPSISPALRLEEFVVILLIVGMASLILVQAVQIQFQEEENPHLEYHSPIQGVVLPDDETATLSFSITGGIYPMNAYILIGYEQLPGLDNIFTVVPINGAGTKNLSYEPSPVFPAGTYFWQVILHEPSINRITYGRVQNFVIEETEEETVEETTPSDRRDSISSTQTRRVGSCPGGPGGFTAPPGGAKTFISGTISPLGTKTLFFNNTDKHAVEKIQLYSMGKSLPATGIILEPWFVSPGLPDAEFPYRLVQFKTTHEWKDLPFFVRLFFQVKKDWMEERNLMPYNIALYSYENSNWELRPTHQIGETDAYYRFEANAIGFHPFVLAGCSRILNLSYPLPPLLKQE